MSRIVTLDCKVNHVLRSVEVERAVKYRLPVDKAEQNLWYIMLSARDMENGRQYYGFIDINCEGGFVSYAVLDEISGLWCYINPERFSEAFRAFISKSIKVSLENHPTFFGKVDSHEQKKSIV